MRVIEDNNVEIEAIIEDDSIVLETDLDYRGERGPIGKTPKINIGNVDTLSPENDAYVEKEGTKENVILNFGIPKGATGDTGPQGIPGPSGVFVGEGEPQDPNVNVWINPREKPENYVRKEQFDYMIPKNRIAGSDNIFDDGLGMPLFDLGGDGKSEQITTIGANILDSEDIVNSNGWHTIEITNLLKKGTRYYVKAKIANSTNKKINIQTRIDYVFNDEKKYVFGTDSADGIVSVDFQLDNFDTVLMQFKPTSDGIVSVDIRNIMLSEKDIPYEPYTGGKPSPSSDYPQLINSIENSLEFACQGQNILPNTATSQTVNDVTFSVENDGSILVNGTASKRAIFFLFSNYENPIELSPGVYSLNSGKKSGGSFLQIEVKNSAGESRYITSSNTANNNVVINEEDVLVAGYIGLDQGQTAINDHIYPILQKGKTSTKYVKYKEPNKVNFNLGEEKLRAIENVKDELIVDLETGDYYKVGKIEEVILDGSDDENYSILESTGNTYMAYIYTSIIDNLAVPMIGTSNYFIKVDDLQVSSVQDECFSITSASSQILRFYINKNKLTEISPSAFKQWLSKNNTIINYALTRPTAKKLGTLSTEDLAKLKTFKGYNNVTVNTNLGLMNIRLTYGLDIKKYVDNKIVELAARKEVV